MSKTYDLVIVGSGAAARGVAERVRKAGWTVAVIDHRPLGGTCMLRGCDPKKVLVGAAEAIDHARRLAGKGVGGEVALDWPALMAFKRGFTDPLPARQEKHYADQGVDTFHATARFVGHNAMEVAAERLEARFFVIAAGAEPVRLGIPGEQHLALSEDFLSLPALPGRIVLVGGGYIAAEFSHVAARAGAEAVVVQRSERLLPHFDPDLVAVLMEKFAAIGVEIHTRTAVETVERGPAGFRVTASRDGRKLSFDTDLVVHAAGRAPALDALDLPRAGVAMEGKRIRLNEFLQSTSNPAVYAVGDAASAGPPLTPVAGRDAAVVAANLIEGNHARPNYTAVPSVAFTIPPIAMVGLGEAEARSAGIRFRTTYERTSGWYSSRQAAEPVAAHKVLVEDGTERILGAHLLGPRADEVINLFALAMRAGLTAGQVKDTLFAYPTGASDLAYML